MERWPRPEELVYVRRVDYVSTDGTEGYYEFDRRDGYVYRHRIKVYDMRALFGYEWKDITPCGT